MKYYLRTILTFVSLAYCVCASALDITFVEGKNVFNAAYQAVNGSYVAKNNGKVLIEAMEEFQVMCNEAKYTHQYVPASSHGAFHYEVDVKAGETITISTAFLFNSPATIWITEGGEGPVPVKIENATPAIGSKFTWDRAGQLTINFNKAVTAKAIKFVANNVNYQVDEVSMGTNVALNVKNAIEEATKDGNLKEGERFGVRFEGLCDAEDAKNLYNGTGILDVVYIAPAVQGQLTAAMADGQDINPITASFPYTFLSYYDAEEDNGVISLEFSRKVGGVSNVYISMGNLDMSDVGQYYREQIKPTIKDNKVIIDLRGKLRSLARMFPTYDPEAGGEGSQMEFDVNHISMQVDYVVDESGNPFAAPGSGSIGSYGFVFNYKEIKDNIVMDGDNCQENDVVTDGQNIRLWIDQELKQIERLLVTYYVLDESAGAATEEGSEYYTVASVEVKAADITVTKDPDGGCIVSFNIPEMKGAAKGQRVIATLSVKTMNGMPHDLSIKFWYGETPTGIGNVTSAKAFNGQAFDIMGRKANINMPGFYIINGKKYMKK